MNSADSFGQMLDSAKDILVTSHISPDPDAVSSLLLLYTTVRENLPNKSISAFLEEKAGRLSFLDSYNEIEFGNLTNKIREQKPDLVIVVDAPNLQRCTRDNAEPLSEYIHNNDIKLAVIDHHQPDDNPQYDIMINNTAPAAAQEVYDLCFNRLGFKKPPGYAITTLTGLYSDTKGFIYKNSNPHQTFQLVMNLIDSGANLETIHNRLNDYTAAQMKVIAELMNNISSYQNYTYSFISDSFYEEWFSNNMPYEDFHVSCKMFIDEYIRNIDDRVSGFIVYKSRMMEPDGYSVSLRSIDGGIDVSKIAKKFGGGGHKPAAGGKLKAKNINSAIEQVKKVIDE